MKGPREEPEMYKISVPELTACGACLHPIVSIRDMFRGENRLSPPEDAVDERLSHGKTGDVLTVLWKNRRWPQFCKCDISGSSLEPFKCIVPVIKIVLSALNK